MSENSIKYTVMSPRRLNMVAQISAKVFTMAFIPVQYLEKDLNTYIDYTDMHTDTDIHADTDTDIHADTDTHRHTQTHMDTDAYRQTDTHMVTHPYT